MQFQVKQALAIAGRAIVIARLVAAERFLVRGGISRLGGAPLVDAQIPQSRDEDGSPDYSVFAFTLVDADDLARFNEGDIVSLTEAEPLN